MSAEPETKINDVIIKLYEVRQLRCYLERQEQEYQLQLNQFLDKNNIEAIKGPSLQLTRKTTTRLRMSKYNLPKEIYEQYAQERLRMSITKKDLPEKIYKKICARKKNFGFNYRSWD